MDGSNDDEFEAETSSVTPTALLKAIIGLTDDAVITCDALARVVLFSENAERLFGLAAHDACGTPFEGLLASHLGDELRTVFAAVRAGERIRHFETEILRPDGLPIPVSLSLAPLMDGDHFAGSVIVARDVTEQHLAQATLAEVDARVEEDEALSHVGSWLWDVRTGAVQWSLEFHRAHGVDPLDFSGTFDAYVDLIDPRDREAIRQSMIQSVHQGRPLDVEYRVVHSDEKVHTIWVHANPTLGSDGTAVGLRGIGRDVTDESRRLAR